MVMENLVVDGRWDDKRELIWNEMKDTIRLFEVLGPPKEIEYNLDNS